MVTIKQVIELIKRYSSGGGGSHARLHSITNILDHSSAATAGRLLKADANGLPIESAFSDVDIDHSRQHSITSTADHTSTATAGQVLKADANGLPVDATNTDAQVSAAVTASHARSHAITSSSDHTSSATSGTILKADANGLPVDSIASESSSIITVEGGLKVGAVGAGTNYSELNGTTGFYQANGSARAWDDVNFPIQSARSGGASVMDIISIGVWDYRAFIGTGTQTMECFGTIEIPHDYAEGTDIYPHFHGVANTASNPTLIARVVLEYVWYNRGSAHPSTGTQVAVLVAGGGVLYGPMFFDFGAIAGSGKLAGSRFSFRLFRAPNHASDTWEHYVVAMDFGIHYQKNTLGTRSITTK